MRSAAWTLLVLVVCRASWLATPVAAQTLILDQPPNQVSSGTSDFDCNVCQSGSLVIAEDFVLMETRSINEIAIWGGYVDDQVFNDNFTVQVFADNAGEPTTPPLVTQSGVPTARELTGLTVGFNGAMVDEYRFTLLLPSPLLLGPGTYWILIANDSTGQAGDFVWGFGTLDQGSGRAGSSVSVSGAVWFANPTNFSIRIPLGIFADGFESGTTNAWSATQR